MKYYFAYGMNTNLKEMAMRCPSAECVGQVILNDHKFVFRLHADIELSQGDSIVGVLWRITSQCEQALDMLEGYPYYYEKKEVVVETFAEEDINGMTHFVAMTYYMVDQRQKAMPNKSYYDCLVEGYNANNISTQQINQAIEHINV